MRIKYSQFKELIPDLNWSIVEVAEKLALSGHETEVINNEFLDISLTANRRDCKDLKYLVFDFAGVYNLKTKSDIIEHGYGNPIEVTPERINRLLGSNISKEDLTNLDRLGFKIDEKSVTPPDFRDIETVADVTEEVVRQIGYNNLDIKPLSKEPPLESKYYDQSVSIKTALVKIGLCESWSSSFTHDGIVEVNDPFSRDEPFLRPNLKVGLLKSLARNPFLKRAAFFEIGSVFAPNETIKLGIIIAGYKNPENWQMMIGKALGRDVTLTPIDLTESEKLDVKQGRLNYCEMPLENINPPLQDRLRVFDLPLPKFKSISKFPPLVRDITLDNSKESFDTSLGKLKELKDLLFVELIDEYQNHVTYRLIWQKMSSSFSQEEISAIDKTLEHFQNSQ